jgi:hypothetical protein
VTANEGIFHITATPKGFFINKSNRQSYDPLPAPVPHYHHDLLHLIESVSASFRNAWVSHIGGCVSVAIRNAVNESSNAGGDEDVAAVPETEAAKEGKASKEIEELAVADANRAMAVYSTMATLYEQRKGDSFSAVLPWNVMKPAVDDSAAADSSAYWKSHKSDPHRMQAFICDNFGIDPNMASRDWYG